MNKNLIYLVLAVLFCGFFLTAQDYNWDKPDSLTPNVDCRVDSYDDPRMPIIPILIGDKKPINILLMKNTIPGEGAATKEQERVFHLFVLTSPLRKDSWTTSTFSFRVGGRPGRKGWLRISFQGYGNWIHEGKGVADRAFMGIAQVSSPQISFPNGGYFVKADLKAWNYKGKIEDKHMEPTILTDESLSTPDKKFMRVCQPLVHYVYATAGQEFTITLTAKAFEYFTALN